MRRVTRPAPAAQVRAGRGGESVKVVCGEQREEAIGRVSEGRCSLGLEAGERARWEPGGLGGWGLGLARCGGGALGAEVARDPGLGAAEGFAV